ncbi:MAG: hypothetical protein HUJ83_10445 [Veillonella sp.]|nr:hypothetical protein [Veillonella sp.]
MKRYNKIISTLAVAMAFASCQKEDLTPSGNGKYISINNVTISENVTSRSSNAEIRELPPIEIDGNIIRVTEIVTPMEEAPKSRFIDPLPGAMTMANLQDAGFKINGYIQYAGQTGESQNILSGDNVTFTDSKWYLNTTAVWRDNIMHNFLAYYGNIKECKVYGSQNKASFTYTNGINLQEGSTTNLTAGGENYGGAEDLLIAYHSQFHNTEGTETEKSNNIDKLPFTHALAKIEVDASGIQFYQPTSEPAKGTTPTYNLPCPNRVEIPRIVAEVANIGTCSADFSGDKPAFTWTAGTVKEPMPIYIPSTEQVEVTYTDTYDKTTQRTKKYKKGQGDLGFFIPQTKSDGKTEGDVKNTREITITILDKYSFIIPPVPTENNQSPVNEQSSESSEETVKAKTITIELGAGNWEAGKRYRYVLSGQFNMPWKPTEIDINPQFTGNKWQTLEILKNFNEYGYVKQFTLEWTGVPTTNGNGTFAGVAVLPTGTAPVESDMHNKGNTWNAGYNNLGWSYNANTKQLVSFTVGEKQQQQTFIKGTYDSSSGKCTATFNLDSSGTYVMPGLNITGATSIWLVYFGGDNSAAGWTLDNIKITNIIYY